MLNFGWFDLYSGATYTPANTVYMYVTVHKQSGHNVQKRENMVILQRHNSVTTMSAELILGMAVIEGLG